MVSTDLYLMAEAITDKDGNVKKSICPPERNIMYIENIYIEEKYRGMGIGKWYYVKKKYKLKTKKVFLNANHFAIMSN